jgi:hypothetical protein
VTQTDFFPWERALLIFQNDRNRFFPMGTGTLNLSE